jgi:hypothetical protein
VLADFRSHKDPAAAQLSQEDAPQNDASARPGKHPHATPA